MRRLYIDIIEGLYHMFAGCDEEPSFIKKRNLVIAFVACILFSFLMLDLFSR